MFSKLNDKEKWIAKFYINFVNKYYTYKSINILATYFASFVIFDSLYGIFSKHDIFSAFICTGWEPGNPARLSMRRSSAHVFESVSFDSLLSRTWETPCISLKLRNRQYWWLLSFPRWRFRFSAPGLLFNISAILKVSFSKHQDGLKRWNIPYISISSI